MSSPPQEVGEEDPTPVYDPSPEIPSHSGYDPSFIGRRYWFPGDKTHHEPTSTSHVHYGVSDIPTPDLAHHVESKFEPSNTPGGTPIPFHAEIFGSTVTLHLPSQWWKQPHMSVLDLVLVIICGYQN